MKNAEKSKRKFSRIALLHMKTRACLIYFFHDRFSKQFFACNFPQSLSSLILWKILVNMKFSHSYSLKLDQLSCEKVLNFSLLDNYFTNVFTEVKIRCPIIFRFGPGYFLER